MLTVSKYFIILTTTFALKQCNKIVYINRFYDIKNTISLRFKGT